MCSSRFSDDGVFVLLFYNFVYINGSYVRVVLRMQSLLESMSSDSLFDNHSMFYNSDSKLDMPTNQYISVSNAYGQDIFASISGTDGHVIVQRGDEAGKQGFVCKIQTLRKNTAKVLTEHHFTKITHGERASFPVAGLLASEVRISIRTRETNLYMNHLSMSDWRFIVISDGRATRIGNADHGQYWMEFGICYYPGEHDCLNTTFHDRVGQMNHDGSELALENGQCEELVTW